MESCAAAGNAIAAHSPNITRCRCSFFIPVAAVPLVACRWFSFRLYRFSAWKAISRCGQCPISMLRAFSQFTVGIRFRQGIASSPRTSGRVQHLPLFTASVNSGDASRPFKGWLSRACPFHQKSIIPRLDIRFCAVSPFELRPTCSRKHSAAVAAANQFHHANSSGQDARLAGSPVDRRRILGGHRH